MQLNLPLPHQHQPRVDAINRCLAKGISGEPRERLLRERRTLLRIIHSIPQSFILPLDWQP